MRLPDRVCSRTHRVASPCSASAFVVMTLFALAAVGCGSAEPTSPAATEQDPGVPSGWTSGVYDGPALEMGVQNLVVHSGKLAGYFHGAVGGSSGQLSQSVRITDLQGKRLRISAWVDDAWLSDPVYLQVELDGEDSDFFAHAALERPSGSVDHWHQMSLVMDAPSDALALTVAFVMQASGQFYFDDVDVEPVDKTTPLSPLLYTTANPDSTKARAAAFYATFSPTLVNPGFEAGLAATEH